MKELYFNKEYSKTLFNVRGTFDFFLIYKEDLEENTISVTQDSSQLLSLYAVSYTHLDVYKRQLL